MAGNGVTRREMLQVGSLGLAGLSLLELLAAESAGAGRTRRKPAKSCILFFLEGGPSHIDLWDMKPGAPDEIRGQFKPISTKAVGVHICEHLPLLSKQMHHVALVRSVHHKIVDHNAGAYYTLTGRSPLKRGRLITRPSADDFPPYGSVLGKLHPTEKEVLPFVHLPDIMANNNSDLPGQRAGFLRGHDPYVAGDPSTPDYVAPGLQLREDVSPGRFRRRYELLRTLDGHEDRTFPKGEKLMRLHEKAYDILSSDKTRKAFHLHKEKSSTREQYGLPDRVDRSVEARKFGGLPHLGQCLLLSRRLVEAGTRLVTVGTGRRLCQAWDTHRDHFPLLTKSLLPYTDRGFAALLDDLNKRDLLDETLVVAMGEFGRTPKIGQKSSNAGAAKNGRDHWPHCYSVLFAGGGIQGGAVYGASDASGAFPSRDPVTPEDIAATIYYAMGLDPKKIVHDRFGRPHVLALGKPITELFA